MIGMRLEGFRQEGAMVSCAVDLDCCGHNRGRICGTSKGGEREGETRPKKSVWESLGKFTFGLFWIICPLASLNNFVPEVFTCLILKLMPDIQPDVWI